MVPSISDNTIISACIRVKPVTIRIKRILVQPASKPEPLPPRISYMQIKAHNLAMFKELLVKKNLKAARNMINAGLVPLDIRDSEGKMALHYAAAFGDETLVMIIRLIVKTEDLKDNEGNTPLHEAVRYGNLGAARALLYLEVSYKDALNTDGKNPFSLAMDINPVFLGRLLIHSDNSELFDYYKNLSSESRSKIGRQEEIYQSLATNEAKDLLERFISSESFDDARLLIEHAGSLSFIDKFVAAYDCFADTILDEIVSEMKPENFNETKYEGYNALHIACMLGDLKTAAALIKKGADINAKTDIGHTPLHIACGMGRLDLAKLLIQEGAAINAKNNNGDTPLHIACGSQNISLAEFLIQNGADYNLKNEKQVNPIEMGFDKDFETGKQLLQMVSSDNPLDVKTLLSRYMTMNNQAKAELNAIAPFEKALKRKILAHTWGIEGEFAIENIKAEYEGFSSESMRSTTFAWIDQFFKQYYDEPLFEPLRPIFSKAHDYISLDSESLAKKIMQGEVVILPITGKEHVAYLVFSGDNIYKCNRGAYTSEPGIQLFSWIPIAEFDREKALVAFIDEIRRLSNTNEIWPYFNQVMDQKLAITFYITIKQKWQSVGNCSAASLKSAFLAVSFDYAYSQGHREESEYRYHRFYKEFTRWLRAETLHDYLLYSSDLDKQLIKAILDKLEDEDRLQQLFPSAQEDIIKQRSFLAEMRENLIARCKYSLLET